MKAFERYTEIVAKENITSVYQPCWDWIMVLNSLTTISQITQVGIALADTDDKWNSLMQWPRWRMEVVDISHKFLSAVSPWCPRHSGDVNCPLHQHFALWPWLQLLPDEVTLMWVLGEVINLRDGGRKGWR